MSQQLTPNFALPYYQGSDPADGATQQQALAVKLDTVLKPFAPVTVSSLVGETGQTAQARAGRQLALSDFTSLGLSAPRGLWNLSDLTDASGNGRTLSNRNAVGFGLVSVVGVSVVTDDRWHFGVVTYDGTGLRLFVDGVLEGSTATGIGALLAGSAPLNIGGRATDAGTSNNLPHYGRIDEAFVTADVLTEDQIRSLYAARLAHTLGAQPKTVSLSVRRQRRGAALATTDFSTTPLHLYNYAGGSPATDQGSLGLPMSGGAVYLGPGTDGTTNGSRGFIGGLGDNATDAGLPTGLQSRSYGCWIKTANASGVPGVIGWGASNSSTAGAVVGTTSGAIYSQSGAGDTITGPFVADGQWHHVVAVEDNTAGDGVKRKLYLDGRVIANSTVMNSIAPGGAGRFRVGAYPDATGGFTGQIDGVFVTGYAMTTDEVLRLYAKASQTMLASPKNSGDHVEAVDSGSVLVVADTLDAQHYIDLTLA
jgi:hypothetical protein